MQFTPTQKRAASWCLLAALISFALWLLAPVLTPFVVAIVLAYALTPLVDWLDDVGKRRLPRMLAVVVVEMLFIIVVLAVMLLVVPILVKQLPLMREQVPVLLDTMNSTLKPFFAQFGITFSWDVGSIKAFLLKYLNANADNAFASVMTSLKLGGSVAFAIFGNAVLIPVALFYLLLDWHKLVPRVLLFVPPHMRGSFDSFHNRSRRRAGPVFAGAIVGNAGACGFLQRGLWRYLDWIWHCQLVCLPAWLCLCLM